VDIWLEESTGVPTLNGFVFDAINRTMPIVGAEVYLSDPNDITPTTSGGGAYTIMPATTGSWNLWAGSPGYKVESVHSVLISPGINNAPNIYLLPVGDISGVVTDDLTGDPVSGVSIEVRNSANIVVSSAYTQTDGSYICKSITAGSNYTVKWVPVTNYSCVFPATGQHSNVSVTHGTVTPNKNFRIKQAYDVIKGRIVIDGADMNNGVIVMAYPSSVTILAHHYRTDISADHLKGQTGRWKALYPYNGTINERNAEFSILAPVGTTYNIYAYYSYISYTGTVDKPVKTLKKYYKSRSAVSPGTINNDITGNLSSWTEY